MVSVALWYIHTAQDQDWELDRERDQDRSDGFLYDAEMFTLVQVRDIDQDLLFLIVPVLFLVPPRLEKCE